MDVIASDGFTLCNRIRRAGNLYAAGKTPISPLIFFACGVPIFGMPWFGVQVPDQASIGLVGGGLFRGMRSRVARWCRVYLFPCYAPFWSAGSSVESLASAVLVWRSASEAGVAYAADQTVRSGGVQ